MIPNRFSALIDNICASIVVCIQENNSQDEWIGLIKHQFIACKYKEQMNNLVYST